jgi:cell division protein FtsL
MAAKRKKTKSKTAGNTKTWIVVLSVFILELLFFTWCRVQCAQTNIAIRQKESSNQKLRKLQNSLTIELARLKASKRITHIARKQLNMDTPETGQIIMVP